MNYLKRERTDRKTGETSFYYQFRAYNPAKQRYDPVPVSSLPKFIRECDSDEVADKYCNLRSSEENAIKARIQKRLEWREKFQDFDVLLEAFGNDHIKKAPNSWGNDVYYLEKYVFSYFLSKKLANNIPEWPLHYKAFKSWLSTTTKLKGKKETLAINTQNKVIKSLNLFLSFYGDENPTEHQIKKCSTYPRNMCRQSTADDILEDHEIEPIFTALKSIRPISADLFYVLTKTGMRISEALGLCVHFITEGAMNGTKISSYHKLISKYDLTYHGYICLESQPKLRSIRDESGKVVRKPLKSRDEIAPKYFRYIPICDKEAWKIITRLYDEKIDDLEKNKWGKEERDYLLFEGITKSMFYSDLVKAFKNTNLRFRSPHKAGRHTYLTWLYDVTCDDRKLAEVIAGHRDKAIMDNYGHLAEQVGREHQKKKSGRRKLSKPEPAESDLTPVNREDHDEST